MVEIVARIFGRYGIHARPAGAIRNAAVIFSETEIVLIDPNDRTCVKNAKCILELLTFNKKCGDTLIVRARGKDEEAAAEAVATVIREFEVA
jgi:phosphotransferase system HPr (HPr) family protein